MDYPEVVSGRWLVKAMLATLAAAGIALYCTVCLLFYQGQWQFVFSPQGAARKGTAQSSVEAIANASGLPISNQKFDYTEEGVARLDGWWIPASSTVDRPHPYPAQSSGLSSMVVLFCPDGRSVLPENVAALRAFHALGVAVFAFDYRGFGASRKGHPSQQKAYEDGAAALQYLVSTRHVDQKHIVIYGAELGAAVAAHVAQQSHQIAGVVLENPQPSLAPQVKREQHIHALPMWLIFTDRFDISGIVPTLKMPKLILSSSARPEYADGAAAVYNDAGAPKEEVRVATGGASLYTQPSWQKAMRKFLAGIVIMN